MRFPWARDSPDSSRGHSMHQRAGWTKCSQKGNNTEIAWHQDNALLIGDHGQIEGSLFHRRQKRQEEFVKKWREYAQESVDEWCDQETERYSPSRFSGSHDFANFRNIMWFGWTWWNPKSLLPQFLFGSLHCTLLVKSPKISTMFVHNHKINYEINKIFSNYNLSLENADCFVFLFHHVPDDLGAMLFLVFSRC